MIRIVKMTFKDEEIENFLNLFNSVKEQIRAFDGCNKLELLQDINTPTIIMTYSHWESETHLEKYRQSELFITTWRNTKVLFKEKAQAWSVEQTWQL